MDTTLSKLNSKEGNSLEQKLMLGNLSEVMLNRVETQHMIT